MYIPPLAVTRIVMRANQTTAHARAQALFKKEEQMREGAKAMAEYKATQQAIRERTATEQSLNIHTDMTCVRSLNRPVGHLHSPPTAGQCSH